MPFILFGGLFANNSALPKWLSWIQYISPIKYCAESLMDIEMMNDHYDLKDNLMTFLDYKMNYQINFLIFIGMIIFLRIIAFFFFKALVTKVQ